MYNIQVCKTEICYSLCQNFSLILIKYSDHITSMYFYTFTCLRIIANVNVHLKILKKGSICTY